MNHKISVLFRAIPLLMAAVCFGYGTYIFAYGDAVGRLTAGPVVFFLGSVCVALFTTAATIIRQIIGTYNETTKYALPAIGYLFAFVTFFAGVMMLSDRTVDYFVTGHVVCGLGFITACVSTACAASTRFALIPKNASLPAPANGMTPAVNPKGFSVGQELLLETVVSFMAVVAWAWALILLSNTGSAQHFVAGSVMGGIACICTSLIALVSSIARQARGNYSESEKSVWIWLVLTMGFGAIIWGLCIIFLRSATAGNFVGYILCGLGLICLSISSKVILLARVWRADYPLAKRIPIIPVVTALSCLFLGAFLFEAAIGEVKFFVPARVLVGFGAICFTLFSIVSILESGTSKNSD